MAQQTPPLVNKFIKGVNTDVAEDLLPADFMSDGHNIKLTNNDNKQGIVQKQEGYIKKPEGYPLHLKPLAVKEFNDVAYFISYDIIANDGTIEIGTYPSADLTDEISPGVFNKVYKYAPLPNFKHIPLVYAAPQIFYDVATIAPSVLSPVLTTNTDDSWIVTAASTGVTYTPSTGATGSSLNITIPDNYSGHLENRWVRVKEIHGDVETQISIFQRNDPWILASPDTFNNVPNNNDPFRTSTINTYTSDWVLNSYDAALTPSAFNGNAGDPLTLTVNDNPGSARALHAEVKLIDASSITDTITINQKARIPSTGDFSIHSLTGASGTDFDISINYTLGSYGTGWRIDKISGAATTVFTPSTGIGNTSVVATISGNGADTASFNLVDDRSGDILGSQLVTTISAAAVPSVKITLVRGITIDTMVVDCSVISDGGLAITQRGICWNTTGSPTTADNTHILSGSGSPWTSYMNTLTINTTYHIKPFAKNSAGTGYGDEVTRSTLSSLPSISISSDPTADPCNYSGSYQTVYFHGANAKPVALDMIYSDSLGTTPFNGEMQQWKEHYVDTYYEIDVNGEVMNVYTC